MPEQKRTDTQRMDWLVKQCGISSTLSIRQYVRNADSNGWHCDWYRYLPRVKCDLTLRAVIDTVMDRGEDYANGK